MKQKKSTIKFLKKKSKQNHQSNEVNNSKKTNTNKKSGKTVNNKQRISKQDQLELNDDDNGNFIKLKDNSKSHQDELKNLQRSDPEFYDFLQKNDTSLLEFNDDDDDDDELDDDVDDDEEEDSDDNVDDDDDDSDMEDGSIRNYKNQKEKKRIELTIDLISITASKALKSDSLTELKKLLSMFRSACIPSGDTSDSVSSGDMSNEEKLVSKYVIPSAEVYEKAMVSAMDTICQVFARLLGIKNLASISKSSLEQLHKHPNWKKLQLCVVSYFKSILHTLEGLVDSTTQSSDVTVFLIDSLEKYIPFLAPLPRLAKNVVKMLLNIWCQQSNMISTSTTATSTSNNLTNTGLSTEHLLVRGHAFLRIRQIAMCLPGALAEECFRSIYLKFARHTKTYNEYTSSSEVFMMQSIAELYGTDLALAYQQSFLYIRQLALHLRAALLKKSDDTTRQITSMQYLNCLRLWTRVICCHPSDEQGLGALAFPLVQIILGTISATPSIYYTPLKFNLIVCLHQIAASCKVFIPSTASIIEVLEHPDMTSKTTGSTDLPPKIEYLVRFQANSISKAIIRDTMIQEAVQLIRQDIEIYRYHVGLPEYIYLTIRKLKLFLKKCKVTKWRDQVRILIGQMEQYSTQVQKARVLLASSKHPMDMVEFEPLLPTNTPNAQIRLFKLIMNNSKKDITIPDINDVTNRIHSIASKTTTTDKTTASKDLFVTSYSTIKKQHDNLVKSKLKKQTLNEEDNNDDDSNNNDDDDVNSNDDEDSNDDMEYDNYEFNQEEDVDGDEFEELDYDDDNNTDNDEVNNNNTNSNKKQMIPSKNNKNIKDKSSKSKIKKRKGLAHKDTMDEALEDTVDELHWDDD